MDDIETLYEEALTVKNGHKRKTAKKTIKVRSSVEKAADDFKKAKATHKAEIAKLKTSIKSHKLLIKQAKNQLKLVKLAEKSK